jgi:hypothetical protein
MSNFRGISAECSSIFLALENENTAGRLGVVGR